MSTPASQPDSSPSRPRSGTTGSLTNPTNAHSPPTTTETKRTHSSSPDARRGRASTSLHVPTRVGARSVLPRKKPP
ncbi:hypothetical protein ACFPRL_17620 [Pseudoclavibacter helvolus]